MGMQRDWADRRGGVTDPADMGRADALQERLLEVMDRKDHVAWLHFTKPGLTPAQLLVHFRHEYLVYVRDFPVLLARILGQGPPETVRRSLAENLYEEQTGGLSLGDPHPELFLEMMEGLGISREVLEAVEPSLAPEARVYRAFLDRVSITSPWVVGAAVMTIFVEGSVNERAELAGKRELLPVDEAIAAHPMVAHYGCPPEKMRLLRAHRQVEGGHRRDAWHGVLSHVGSDELGDRVVDAVEQALSYWLGYRNAVARLMGLASAPPASLP